MCGVCQCMYMWIRKDVGLILSLCVGDSISDVALAVLELVIYIRLAGNSENSACHCPWLHSYHSGRSPSGQGLYWTRRWPFQLAVRPES